MDVTPYKIMGNQNLRSSHTQQNGIKQIEELDLIIHGKTSAKLITFIANVTFNNVSFNFSVIIFILIFSS